MTESVLQRAVIARWALATPFAVLGLIFLVLTLPSGALTFPIGILFVGVAWWLLRGASLTPSVSVGVLVGIGLGLTLLEVLAVVVLLLVQSLNSH